MAGICVYTRLHSKITYSSYLWYDLIVSESQQTENICICNLICAMHTIDMTYKPRPKNNWPNKKKKKKIDERQRRREEEKTNLNYTYFHMRYGSISCIIVAIPNRTTMNCVKYRIKKTLFAWIFYYIMRALGAWHWHTTREYEYCVTDLHRFWTGLEWNWFALINGQSKSDIWMEIILHLTGLV